MDQHAGANSPHLDQGEQDQAAEHAAPGALVVHEVVRAEGEVAINRTTGALAWSGLAAGLSMGFSFLTQSVLHGGLPDARWRHLVDGFGYSTGFVIVILGRQQLFTESTLTAVLPVLVRKDGQTLLACLRLWAIVLVANLAGAWVFAALLTPEHILRPEVKEAMRTLSTGPMQQDILTTGLKAVFAGWLIAMMVWLLPSARSARLLTVLLLTYVVAIAQLNHIIAGSVDTAYAVLIGAASLGDYFTRFMLPTLVGNTVGGVALVALLNHAAIAPDIGARQKEGAAQSV